MENAAASSAFAPIRLAFYAAVAVVVATAIVLITNLPTIADVIVSAGSMAMCVIAGRKSRDWF